MGLGGSGDGRVVCVGDRLDDGQAEPGPVLLAAPVWAKPLEGPEEPVDVGSRPARSPGSPQGLNWHRADQPDATMPALTAATTATGPRSPRAWTVTPAPAPYQHYAPPMAAKLLDANIACVKPPSFFTGAAVRF